MLWKSTSLIGVGMAKNDTSEEYVLVCFYHPRLNRLEYMENFGDPVVKVYIHGFPDGAVSAKPIAIYVVAIVVLTRIC